MGTLWIGRRKKAKSVIATYIEASGNFNATARMYFDSEECIGAALDRMSVRSDIVTATKTAKANTLENISLMRKDLEESLRNLKTDYVDIYRLCHQFDDPDVIETCLLEIEQLKKEGNILYRRIYIKVQNVTQDTAYLIKQ